MLPKSIAFISEDGTRIEYDHDFIAYAKHADDMHLVACKAEMPDVAYGTAMITAKAMLDFFTYNNTSKLRRLRIMANHIRLWGKLVRALYHDLEKEEPHE